MTTMTTDDPLRLDEQRDAEPIRCANCERAIVQRPDEDHRPAPLESFGEHFCNERCKQERNAERFEHLAALLESDAKMIENAVADLQRKRPNDALIDCVANQTRDNLYPSLREYGIKTPGGA